MTAADSPAADAKASEAFRIAQDQIAEAARVGSTTLNLAAIGLTNVPPEIGQLANITYGRKKALNQLSLRIPHGRIHAIVGANGAGKSSLFRILLGIQSPTAACPSAQCR